MSREEAMRLIPEQKVYYYDTLGIRHDAKVSRAFYEGLNAVTIALNGERYIVMPMTLGHACSTWGHIFGTIEEQIPNVRSYFERTFIQEWARGICREGCFEYGVANRHIINRFIEDFGDDRGIRRCSVCGNLYSEGYVEDAGHQYFCSDRCLHTQYTDAEWKRECAENDQSYYTTF